MRQQPVKLAYLALSWTVLLLFLSHRANANEFDIPKDATNFGAKIYLTDSIFERDDTWVTVPFVSLDETISQTFPITVNLGKVDPWEEFNREIHDFNTKFDDYLYLPLAKGYYYITPDFVDAGVTNFFGNLGDVPNFFYSLLQFKFRNAGTDLLRFGLNSTVGLLGLIDVASRLGLEKYNEDLGQTLGHWGVPSGPYIVVPFYGPSTVRDALSDAVEAFAPNIQKVNPLWHVEKDSLRYALFGLKYVDIRSDFIPFEALVQGDKYIYYREFYLNQRRLQVYDGNPPDDFGNEFTEDVFNEAELDDDDDEAELDDEVK